MAYGNAVLRDEEQELAVFEDSEWKEIPGFPNYWVSQHGQVFNMRARKVISQWSNNWGIFVTLRRDNKAYSRKVETLRQGAWGDK